MFRQRIWAGAALVLGAGALATAVNSQPATAPRRVTADTIVRASGNGAAIREATGRLELPGGTVFVDAAPVLTAANNGLTIVGSATSLIGIGTSGSYIERGALAIRPGHDGLAALSFYEPPESRPAVMPPGQVGWTFPSRGDGTYLFPGSVTRFLSGQAVPKSDLAFMRAFRGIPFTGTNVLSVPPGHGLRVGDDVFATDGPVINEVRTEWRRIMEVGPDHVVLDLPLTLDYRQGTLVAGPFPRQIEIRGITFSADMGPVLVQQSVDIRFVDCTFLRNSMSESDAGRLSIIGCGRIHFERCRMDCGVIASSSHDITFVDCSTPHVIFEQEVRGVTWLRCKIGHIGLDSRIRCTGWRLIDCDLLGDAFVYDGWLVSDCRARGASVIVRGHKAVVRNLRADRAVKVEAVYQGAPEKAGRSVVLDSIDAPAIVLADGTTGRVVNTISPVSGVRRGWEFDSISAKVRK